jgi:hypothetical protein
MKAEELAEILKGQKGKKIIIEAGFNYFPVGKVEVGGEIVKISLGHCLGDYTKRG